MGEELIAGSRPGMNMCSGGYRRWARLVLSSGRRTTAHTSSCLRAAERTGDPIYASAGAVLTVETLTVSGWTHRWPRSQCKGDRPPAYLSAS